MVSPSNLAAEDPVNAAGIGGDDRQHHDAGIEEESQRRFRGGRAVGSSPLAGIGSKKVEMSISGLSLSWISLS